MSTLRVVKPNDDPDRLLLDELLGLLGPEHFDRIEGQFRTLRESYACPFTVRDYDAFKDALVAFFNHYQKIIFNADHELIKDYESRKAWHNLAIDFIERHLGGPQALTTMERNAIYGRDGGMISVIDKLTDALLKSYTEIYIRGVFFDKIGHSDYETRYRLAQELLARYGKVLFPNEELLPYYLLGNNLEALFHGFVTHLHAIRREWRR